MKKILLLTGTISAGLAVATGAFGAHALKEMLTENDKINAFETAFKYQFFHAFALLAVGILLQFNILQQKHIKNAGIAFIIGTILFSGSLYMLSLTNISFWGAITPFGGFSFIIGWILFTIGILKAGK